MGQEYRWYQIGCDRLGQTPLDETEFAVRWQEYEDHAEKLRVADKNRTLLELDAGARTTMEKRIQDDPFVKAVLVGMAEEQPLEER